MMWQWSLWKPNQGHDSYDVEAIMKGTTIGNGLPLYVHGVEYGERGILIYMDAVSAYPPEWMVDEMEAQWQESQRESTGLLRKVVRHVTQKTERIRQNSKYGKP